MDIMDRENIAAEDIMPAEESTLLILGKALLGAMLGAIPAMLLWVVLGKVGYLAAISGFFMMAGEIIACDHFTRKSRNMNIQTALVICVIVMIIDVYLCERFVWSWELCDVLNEYSEDGYSVGIFDCFKNFSEITEVLEIQADFTSSLVKSYLFAVLGAVAGVMKLAKK
ncbi:MAG: hypothetical protein J6K92_00265 [Oscillospiraceae bacterium]|nr:hypothetical protein [Oscillospiraceae bacterium]